MKNLAHLGGIAILIGLTLCIVSIAVCGLAGVRKERELVTNQQTDATSEFSLGKVLTIAIASGLLSACFAVGVDRGIPIAELSIAQGTSALIANNVVLVVI